MAKLVKHTNGRFYVHYHDGSRSRQVSTKCTEKQPAEQFLAQFLTGQTPTKDDLTVAGILDIHYRDHGQTLRNQAATLSRKKILTEHLGDLKAQQLTKARLNRYAKARCVKRGTLRTELAHLQAALNHCVRDGYLSVAPVIDLPRPSPVKDRILSVDECDALLAASEGDLHTFILIGLETGARPQAILDLTWGRVDFERGQIDFLPEGEEQTSKRRPTVPASERLLGYLSNMEKLHNTPVITSGTIPYQFKRLCQRLGLKDVTPHTLRHTLISHALMAGKDIYLVAKFVGDNVQTIEQRYAKYRPDYLKEMTNVWRCEQK
ncbi:site-specific recombinase XerC [Modicisalibacter xianhensis]|uniref:Site-specific recombinase XerC n=1 Tax=Modicisalibacter xianhensis TaxID=442341 RepID=A0A4R8F8X5_9GAMM|nr:site-specific integrase [Halomonas xianhensis]TDX21652.1 site-specific recombinase XerC [Halomonas xianhensis]